MKPEVHLGRHAKVVGLDTLVIGTGSRVGLGSAYVAFDVAHDPYKGDINDLEIWNSIPALPHDRCFLQNVTMRQLRVLLVEDHDFTRATMTASLRAEQCTVVASVPSARDAMRAVNENHVDCAVIDFNLGPGPTGLDLAHRLREHDPHMAIVILTGYRDPRLHPADPQPLPAGAQYLVKDEVRSTSQLRQVIDVALGHAPRPVTQIPHRLPLTDIQVEILRMVAEGLTNAEIAQRRSVSERSVHTVLSRIIATIPIDPIPGVNPRMQLVHYYHSVSGSLGVN